MNDSEIATQSPCPVCGCDPDDPWYCMCTEPGCPCFEEGGDDDDDE